jgi:hypothetical protein
VKMFDKISLAMARSYTRAHTTSAENFRLTEIRRSCWRCELLNCEMSPGGANEQASLSKLLRDPNCF